MKPIREQLREQAETIREAWAKGPSPDGMPRRASIELTLDSPVLPLRALRDYRGRVNSDATYAPVGCLLLGNWRTQRTAELFNGGLTIAQRITADLEYPEVPWKILMDASWNYPCLTADFNEWLDALEPPCGGTSSAPDDPSPESGSWRTRRGLL